MWNFVKNQVPMAKTLLIGGLLLLASGCAGWNVVGDDMYSIPPGKVGIGTTTPLTKLDVRGAGMLVTNGAGLSISPQADHVNLSYAEAPVGSGYFTNAGFYWGKTRLNGNLGLEVTNPTHRLQLPNTPGPGGSGLATDWLKYSSREYKEDIVGLEPKDYAAVLEEIEQMELVYYRYKNQEDERRYLGVVAEDAPEQVVTPDRKGLSLSEFTAFSIAGLKAQQAYIKALQKTDHEYWEALREQEKAISALREEIKSLREQVQNQR